MQFNSRKINPQHLGSILRKKREEKKITLSEVERKLKIGKSYLLALEEGNYQDLPNIIYARKFLERYSEFLGLPSRDLVARLEKEASHFFKKPILKRRQLKLRKVEFRYIPFALAGVLLAGYLFSQILPIFSPPPLEVYLPIDGQVVYHPSLTVKGRTEKGALLYINDHPIPDFLGPEFENQLMLEPGLNIVKISVRKKYSRPTTVSRRVIFIEAKPHSLK